MDAFGSNAKTRLYFRLKRAPLQRLLAKRNLSQNDLARRCGISSGFMSQLLSGERHAGPRTRQKIMEVFPAAAFDQLFEEIEIVPLPPQENRG